MQPVDDTPEIEIGAVFRFCFFSCYLIQQYEHNYGIWLLNQSHNHTYLEIPPSHYDPNTLLPKRPPKRTNLLLEHTTTISYYTELRCYAFSNTFIRIKVSTEGYSKNDSFLQLVIYQIRLEP